MAESKGALAVFAALSAEQRSFQRHLRGLERTRIDGFPAVIGKSADQGVVLCRSGIGRGALAAAEATFARYSPSWALSFGFAGAIAASLKGGDVLICESVYLHGSEGEGAPAVRSEGALLALAEAAARSSGVPYTVGSSITVSHILGQPAEKATAAAAFPAQVVEMESYWLGRAARERGIPFLAVRAVTDTARDVVPDMSGLMDGHGSLRWGRLGLYLAAHPGSVIPLVKLAGNTLRAGRNLSAFAGEFLSLWSRPG
jgi:adenosylhomocysteine nucleosidase